ncbi:MAG: right-handed parallel beta-helix repeat-containing protein [Candidatus Hydrogenedentes bacterium]|nr:right-handed parallel beta-helix repeat-containing protein [Candidatus Hydrogenedentota bacterium]
MATYYVDPVSGSDGAAGTSFGAAWATTQKAADTAVAGDIVYLCATGEESISAKIDMDTNAGGAITPIRFIAANSSGTVDGTKYTIKATSAITGILDFAGGSDYTIWRGVIFNGNSNATYCIYNNVDGSGPHVFRGCTMKNATSHGVYVRGATGTYEWQFYNCRITANGGSGLAHSTGNRGQMFLFGCSIDNNTANGWLLDKNLCVADTCLFYRNGSDGIEMASNSDYSSVMQCTFYLNTHAGIELYNATSREHYQIAQNSFVSNGTYGIKFQTGNEFTALYCDYNHAYNNTSGATDLSGNLLPGYSNQTGDPLFVAVGAGSEDFRLSAGSPLIGTGLNGTNIGAMGQNPSAAGGGGPIMGGMVVR